jgi:hypothetical protein
MAQVNVNTDALVVFTNKLQKLSATAFPNVVRKTLNDTATDMKKRTLPRSAAATFEKRQPNFFKAFSRVNFAKGGDVNSMQSEVGFMEQGLKGGRDNFAVKDLEQQEFGGGIGGRSLIPVDAARIGGSRSKNVRAKNRIANKKHLVEPADVSGRSQKERWINPADVSGRSQKERWIKSVIHAGVGGLVRGTYNKDIVFRIKSIAKDKGGIKAKTEAVYEVKKGRTVKVKGTKFAEKAAMNAAETMPQRYIAEAEKRFLR